MSITAITARFTRSIIQTAMVVETNGAGEQVVVRNQYQGLKLKEIQGIASLVQNRQTLPVTGWIFVSKDFPKESVKALDAATFFIPETDDDEFWGEDNMATWLEIPTFRMILTLREKTLTKPSWEDYASAAIHYLQHDDFLE